MLFNALYKAEITAGKCAVGGLGKLYGLQLRLGVQAIQRIAARVIPALLDSEQICSNIRGR